MICLPIVSKYTISGGKRVKIHDVPQSEGTATSCTGKIRTGLHGIKIRDFCTIGTLILIQCKRSFFCSKTIEIKGFPDIQYFRKKVRKAGNPLFFVVSIVYLYTICLLFVSKYTISWGKRVKIHDYLNMAN